MLFESKNPKIEQAVEQLRNEPHSDAKAHDALAAMRMVSASTAPTRRRKFLLGSVPAGAAVVAVVAFAFYPKGKADFAWAQAVEKSQKANRVHQWMEQDGKVMYDMWYDSGKYSMELKKADGKQIGQIIRSNGKKFYIYYSGSENWQTKKILAYQYVGDEKRSGSTALDRAFVGMTAVEGEFPIKDHALSNLYKLEKSSVKSEESTLDGKEVFIVSGKLVNPPKGRLSDVKIYADRTTHLVLRIDNTDGGVLSTMRFEYPGAIDQKLFEPLNMPNVPKAKSKFGPFGQLNKKAVGKMKKI